MSRKKLRNERPRAFWGAAIGGLVGGVMNMFSSNSAANAQVKAAQAQAQAQIQGARIQADAINQQTKSNETLQKESMALQKSQWNESKRMQERLAMNNAMQAGQLAEDERKRAGMIVAKKGVVVNNRNRKYSLWGGDSKLQVTDGGYLQTLGVTPDGLVVKEAIGNDHEHYHKTRGGKYKSGVGLKLRNGQEIEVEGNQNSSVGELVVETPNDIIALSKHSIKGYNPTKDVLYNGQHPLVAANIQENIKQQYGIDNDDTEIAKFGACRKLRNGGRKKAFLGLNNFTGTDWGSLAGSGINMLGSLAGGLIQTGANNKAAGILTDANNQATRYLVDAYTRMNGIDMSELSKEDYEAPNIIAAVAPTYVNRNPELVGINRDTRAQAKRISRSTLSSAAAQNRIQNVVSRVQDAKSKIYADVANQEQQYRRATNSEINQVNIKNAENQIAANREYNSARLNLLQYNNNIENSKIAGIANAQASNLTQNASINASTATANAQTRANMLSSIGNTLSDTINTIGTNYASYMQQLQKGSLSEQVSARMEHNSPNDRMELKRIASLASTPQEMKDNINSWLYQHGYSTASPSTNNTYNSQQSLFGKNYANSFSEQILGQYSNKLGNNIPMYKSSLSPIYSKYPINGTDLEKIIALNKLSRLNFGNIYTNF